MEGDLNTYSYGDQGSTTSGILMSKSIGTAYTVGTLTITKNGTSVGTFNGSANTTIALTDTTYSDATTTTHGLMTATDKVKLNSISSDASGNISFPGTVTASGDIYYKKSVSTADVSSGVLSISSLTKFINISTSNGTITSINNTATGYNAGDEIILYGTFTYNVDGSSINVTDGAMKIVYTGTKFVRLY